MPRGLRRFHESGQSHFVTFSCCRRQAYFSYAGVFDLFVRCLEDMRLRFNICVYGYVVMPEHVHLLLSEPGAATLAEAIHYLKLSFAKRARSLRSSDSQVSAQKACANVGHRLHPLVACWEKRYYDRNVRDYDEFKVKLRYLHRNPVKRGLVQTPEEWKWSSYRHYALREIGVVEIESEWTARDREVNVRGGDGRVSLLPR